MWVQAELQNPPFPTEHRHGLEVVVTRERNTWVSLPAPLVSTLYNAGAALPLALTLSRPGHASLAVAWAGEATQAGKLGVPAGLASALGLRPGERVDARSAGTLPVAESVSVEPANADDWEVVEMNAAYLEDHILSQVRDGEWQGGTEGSGCLEERRGVLDARSAVAWREEGERV